MMEQRDLIADLVLRKYLDDTNPNWSTADGSVLRPRYWALRKANPNVEHLEELASDLGHPDFPKRIERLANELRDWLKNPSR